MNKAMIRSTAMLIAGFTSTAVLAQPQALTIDDLPEARRIPAERTAAAALDPEWAAPRTSWGHPSLEGTWSTDDMRGIPRNRPEALGNQESLPEDQFLQRALRDHSGRVRAEDFETFLRNEWGVRTFGYSSTVIDPPDGRTPQVNDQGRARAQAVAGRGTFGNRIFNTFEDFSLYDRCISRGLSSGFGAAIYGNGIRIAQSPNAISITYEMIHETRVIPLDNRPPLDENIRFYAGSGRGYWDGDTLVIESGNFNDQISLGGAPQSENMRVTERLRRVDPEMIEYRATIDDPDTYSAPFTVRVMWTQQPDYYAFEYSCHEGNSAVGSSLSGERAHERRVAEAIARGETPPERGGNVYGAPDPDAQVFDINRGE
jgi:hypothetical protein